MISSSTTSFFLHSTFFQSFVVLFCFPMHHPPAGFEVMFWFCFWFNVFRLRCGKSKSVCWPTSLEYTLMLVQIIKDFDQ